MGCDLPRCERIPEIAIRLQIGSTTEHRGTAQRQGHKEDRTKLLNYPNTWLFTHLYAF